MNQFPASSIVARRGVVVGLILSLAAPTFAQTRLKLSSIKPGTERVQLINNGDFQFQGAVTTTNTHPFPAGWTRVADIYADAGPVVANGKHYIRDQDLLLCYEIKAK